MLNLRCTTDNYEALYAPWLADPGRLLDAAGWQPGQVVLDLCGGTGAIARECLRRGAEAGTIHLLDLNPRCQDDRIVVYKGDANDLAGVFSSQEPECHGMYDLIVIRQAAAYLDWSYPMLIWLQALLKPGGKLVFNLFVKAPRVRVKAKRFQGRWFFEAGCRLFGHVYHVQASPGIGIDVTRFRQLNKGKLAQKLLAPFDVGITDRGNSQTWVCTRR